MSIEQQYSRYLPIWKELKAKGKCRITAPPTAHRRIIKAVKKRRDKDTEFLYELAESNKSHRLRIEIAGSIITFTLNTFLTLRGL